MRTFPETQWGQDKDLDDAVTSPAVADTTEVRWFAAGVPSPPVAEWFTRAGTAGTFEERCDTYRVDGRPDLGVKWRHRSTLELKFRWSVGLALSLTDGPTGRTEYWRRWSPAGGLVAADRWDYRFVDVRKRIVRRSIMPTGDVTSSAATGCHVELTNLQVLGIDTWSLAFAAFGSPQPGRRAIVAAWRALTEQDPAPRSLAADLQLCSGYPAWLSGIVSEDSRTAC